MAVLDGALFSSPVMARGNPNLSPAMEAFEVDYWPPHGSATAVAGAGERANNLPIEVDGWSYTGAKMSSYRDDYYNRVHIRPNPIDLGNLLSEQTRDIEVWNAHFNSKQLSDIIPDGDEGLLLTEPDPPPTTFGPLESRIYQLSVSTDGPPNIDATYAFDFPDANPVLTVTGTRVVVWPFKPNWAQPVTDRYEWLTDIIESDDSSEQAIMLRAHPRRTLSFMITLANTDKRRMEALLWQWQARLFAVPFENSRGRLTADATAGDLEVYLDTTYRDYKDDGLAILISNDRSTVEAVEIDTVFADHITLARPLPSSWQEGAMICPALLGRLQDTQALNLYTSRLLDGLVQFSIENNTAITGAEFNATMYRGYPVLEERPNWRDDITVEYHRKLHHFDNLTGVRTVDDMSGRPVTIQSFLWTRAGRAAIHALRQWLHARKGRLIPIWVSSQQEDIVLLEALGDTAVTLNIENIGYARYLDMEIGRRDICIRLRDGSRYYRRITGCIEVDDTKEQLVIDDPLGVTINPEDISTISWMQLSRMASDSQELVWHTSELVECRHLLRGLNDAV